jgi:hypothetical protein
MNTQLVPSDTTMRQIAMREDHTGVSIAPQNLGDIVRFAEVMAKADIALPKHLRGNPGACMAVAMQALEWEMSPFAVAQKSYSVNGTIAYEAQLIAAVVNTRSGIKGRLRYAFDGTGDKLTCTVTGTLDGEDFSYTSPPVGAITTKNSPLWKSDPQQQLGYFSARSWARRYVPEVLLGVYDRDETEAFGPDNARDVTPAKPALGERLRSGASSAPIDGEIASEGFQFNQPGVAQSQPGDAGSPAASGVVSQPPVDDAPHSAPTSSPVADQDGSGSSSSQTEPGPSAYSDEEFTRQCIAAVRICLGSMTPGSTWADVKDIVGSQLKAAGEALGGDAPERLRPVYVRLKSMVEGEIDRADALAIIAGLIGCEEHELA